MSRELMGFLALGPESFEEEKLTEAEVRVRKVQAAAYAYMDAEGREDDDFDPDECLDTILQADEGNIASYADLDPDQFITDLSEAWCYDRHYPDYVSRRNPHCSGEIIVFVGDATYGDGPDEGTAWHLLSMAANMGLFEILGIY